ncbi:MAG: phytanoyl-CoA dioxygenase family protein [Microthrixaceae bacterium]
MRRILNDLAKQQELLDVGFIKVQMLDESELGAFNDEFDQLKPDDKWAPDGTGLNRSSYHCTFLDTNKEYKRQAQDLIRRVFQPKVDVFMADYRILTSNLYVKQPGVGRFQIHQNWPTTIDLSITTLTVWCPMHDVDETNGTLRVVPRSHKILPDVATPQLPPFFADFEDALIDRYLEPVTLLAGEALIFDDSLLHWSSENLSDKPRRAVQIETLPSEETAVLYHLDERGPEPQWEVFEVDDDFFVDHSIDMVIGRPSTQRRIGLADFVNQSCDETEFALLLEEGPEIRRQVYAGAGWPSRQDR